ncbi:MAG: hypothetical protein ACRD26_17735 [Vicinamibacterales bacterium]
MNAVYRKREATEQCRRCGTGMRRAELRVPSPRAISRVGSPVPPHRTLPTWQCQHCGCIQPRFEE